MLLTWDKMGISVIFGKLEFKGYFASFISYGK